MATSLVKWMIAAIIFSFPQNKETDITTKHPFYVSVIEIDQNAKDKTLEISCKIFINDLETALEKTFNTKVDLNNAKSKDANDKMISTYIMKHFQIAVDGKPQQLQFVGSENKSESVWSYFQVNNIASVKKIDIKSNILYESFESEINILHVTVSGNRKSLEVTNPNNSASFEF
ncbi:MAG TPA: DUF6702 family protein [Puia sp.]|jgi:hypothetical protein|nr:DUF6702 family protein [Puia sp.]